jgi:hypothetical protein
MPDRRQHQGSFREPADRLVPRVAELDKQRLKRPDVKGEAKKPQSRCEAFHNQILFEQAER